MLAIILFYYAFSNAEDYIKCTLLNSFRFRCKWKVFVDRCFFLIWSKKQRPRFEGICNYFHFFGHRTEKKKEKRKIKLDKNIRYCYVMKKSLLVFCFWVVSNPALRSLRKYCENFLFWNKTKRRIKKKGKVIKKIDNWKTNFDVVSIFYFVITNY